MEGTPRQAAEDLPRLKELGIDHVFYDMNHPAHVPIDAQLLLLRRLMRLIKNLGMLYTHGLLIWLKKCLVEPD